MFASDGRTALTTNHQPLHLRLPKYPGAESSGVPYYAILEPDGKVLITSKGPFGNIGMPSEVEGIRHLKQMLEQTAQRLSPAEIDALEKSLAPK